MLRRLKRMSAEGVVRYAAVLGLVFFLIWSGIILVIWLVADRSTDGFTLWSALEGISSAAAFALAAGGGIVVLVQLNESIDGRNLDTFTNIFERIMSPEQEEARRWIYQEMPELTEQGIAALPHEGRIKVRMVLNTFDYLGFLIRQEWVTEAAAISIIEWVSPIMVKTWAKLGPYVDLEANMRGESDYYVDVRKLAEHCIKWRRDHIGKDIVWLQDAL